MTNEELAVLAREHKPGAMLQLWEATNGWGRRVARRYIRDDGNGLTMEDLEAEAFIALTDAVRTYDPDKASFLTHFTYFLRARFRRATGLDYSKAGTGIKKADALTYAMSADEPLGDDPEGDFTVMSSFPDRYSEYAFLLVEYSDLVCYSKNLIAAAMETLTPRQREAIQHRYFDRQQQTEATKQADQLVINAALYRLRHGKYGRELWDALAAFQDFDELKSADRYRAAEYRAMSSMRG